MKLAKTLKNLMSNHMVIFTVVAAIVLIYFINHYATKKGLIQSGMQSTNDMPDVNNNIMNAQNAINQPQSLAAGNASSCGAGSLATPANPLGQNAGPAGVTSVQTNMHGLPANCKRNAVVDPKQLLPKDNNNEFSSMNPMGAGDVANVSLLRAGYHVGINTVGQSLRNANLQLRSEPANPQLNVGPWNTSTIGPDFNRRDLEIGCDAK